MTTIPQMTSAATAAPMSAHNQPVGPPPPEELGVAELAVVEVGDAELDVVVLDSEDSFFFAALAPAAAAASS
jgi:hypothetical protein